jgi:hypothetical protein
VRPARPALVADAAGDGRLDDDRVSGLDPGDGPPDLLDDAGAFMAGDEGVADDVAADVVGKVVMEVAAADADRSAPDEHVVLSDEARRRGLADLDRPDAGQEGRFHGSLIIEQKGGIREALCQGRPVRGFDNGAMRLV